MPDDERIIATVNAIADELTVDGLVRRYRGEETDDGLSGEEFTFTAGEQEFYQQRGLTNEPGRCPECRQARKAQQGGGGYSSGGGGGYSSGGGGGYERAPRQMFAAVCSQCGKDTQVPFRPTGARPVYCSDCFRLMRG